MKEELRKIINDLEKLGAETEDVSKATEPTKEKKKAGRPKKPTDAMKKRVSFTITPNVYEKALAKATDKGESLSELVSNFLDDYTK